MKTAIFNFSLLSKYRAELMGISILGIMLAHICEWSDVQNPIIVKLIDSFSRLSHTDGFLFLSGLGLYYSLSKEITPPPQLQIDVKSWRVIRSYFLRRFWRLVVPFLLISFPFYFIKDIAQDVDVVRYLLDQSSLYFWFHGNNGMWYISVSILLYALFPIIYKIENNNLRGLLTLLFASIAALALIRYMFPDYYIMTRLGLPKIPVFIVGCYYGYLAKEGRHVDFLKYMLLLLALTSMMLLCKKHDDLFFSGFYEAAIRLITLPCCCLVLLLMSKYKCLSKVNDIFKWLGKYSLELFILHMFLYGWIFRLSSYCSLATCGIILFVTTILVCKPIHVAIDKVVNHLRTI